MNGAAHFHELSLVGWITRHGRSEVMPRQDVTHMDPRTGDVEVARDLDYLTARRLVEHERNAGRTAWMRKHERPIRRSYR